MTTLPRPRLMSRSTDLEAEDLPEQVTIALREVAGAAKEGLLAFSVGIGLAVHTAPTTTPSVASNAARSLHWEGAPPSTRRTSASGAVKSHGA